MNDNMRVVNSIGSADHDIQVVVEKEGSDLDLRSCKHCDTCFRGRHVLYSVHVFYLFRPFSSPWIDSESCESEAARSRRAVPPLQPGLTCDTPPFSIIEARISFLFPFLLSISSCLSFSLAPTLVLALARHLFYIVPIPVRCRLPASSAGTPSFSLGAARTTP